MNILPRGKRAARISLLATVVLGVLAPLPFSNSISMISLLTQMVIYSLIAVTLNLLVGYGGQVSIGHAGLLAIGAYGAAYLANHLQLPLPVEIVVAGLLAALVGFVLGLPSGRLSGHYLVIVTLGFGLAIPQIALNATSITKGFTGLAIASTNLGPISMNGPKGMYYFVLVVVVISIGAILSFLSTKTGRSFMAVRDSEAAAAAMGINVARTKVVLFTTSAFFVGIAGDLFARFNGLVQPADFPLSFSLFFLAAVIVGGLASVGGSIAGAALLTYVQVKTSSLGGLSEFMIGAAVVVVLLVVPDGLASLPRKINGVLRRSSQNTAEPLGPLSRSSDDLEMAPIPQTESGGIANA